MEKTLPLHAVDLHHFVFDLKQAVARNLKSWAPLASSEFDGGYFRADTMVPAPKKKGINFNANSLVFKAPASPPVIGVVVSWAQYNRFLHHVAEAEQHAVCSVSLCDPLSTLTILHMLGCTRGGAPHVLCAFGQIL